MKKVLTNIWNRFTQNYDKRILMLPISIILAVCITLTFVGCNRQIVDTTWKYDRAIVQLADGTSVEGKCDSWMDYENSDQIQVVIDGVSYLVHRSNVTLISE